MPTKLLMRALVLAGILFVHFISSLAQEQATASARQPITPEKRALIAKLLEVTEAKKISLAVFNSMLEQEEDQMSDVIWQGLGKNKEFPDFSDVQREELRKKTREDSARMRKRLRDLFSQRIDFAQVVEEIFYDLYDKYFTEAEIKDLVTFYSSSTGKKSIELQPKMFAESMSSMIEKIRPKVVEIMTEFSNEEAERIRKEFETGIVKQPVKPKPKRRSRKRT